MINMVEEELIQKQKEDKFIQRIRELIKEKGKIEFVRNGEEMELISTFKIDNNQWFFERNSKIFNRVYNTNKDQTIDRLVLPQSLKKLVLQECHESGHFNYARTYDKLKERFYWNGMSKDTRDYVASCDECQRRNHTKAYKRGLMFSPKVSKKFELIGVDLYTGIPKGSVTQSDTILVMTDYLTKWVVAIPIKDGKAKTVAEAIFDHWIAKYGPPERIISDEGGEFTAKEIWQELYDVFKIKKHTATAYHQQTNGQCERFNRTMSGMLAKYVGDDQTNWEKYLPTCVLEYNCSKHSVTQESPYFMVFGQEPRLPIDLVFPREENANENNPNIKERIAAAMKRIKKNQKYNKEKYDKRRINEKFKAGDFVLWRQEPRTNLGFEEHAKLISPWYGPATVARDLGENKYLIIDDSLESKIFNVENLKKYQTRPEWMKKDFEEEMEVEAEEIAIPALIPEEEIPIPNQMPIIKLRNQQERDVEKPTGVRRSSRAKKFVPKKGDLIDMKFNNEDDNKEYWICGETTQVDDHDQNRIYVKFLDGKDEDWYDLAEEKLEVRRCIPSATHQRSATMKILNIQEPARNPKESEKKSKRDRQKEEGPRQQKKKRVIG
jgi:hypothetical protein